MYLPNSITNHSLRFDELLKRHECSDSIWQYIEGCGIKFQRFHDKYAWIRPDEQLLVWVALAFSEYNANIRSIALDTVRKTKDPFGKLLMVSEQAALIAPDSRAAFAILARTRVGAVSIVHLPRLIEPNDREQAS